MGLSEVWGWFWSLDPVVIWMVGIVAVLFGLTALMVVLAKWPHLPLIGAVVAVAYYGRAPWLIALLLGVIACYVYAANETLERMVGPVGGIDAVLQRLVRSVDELKSAVERLEPKESREQRERDEARRAAEWAARRDEWAREQPQGQSARPWWDHLVVADENGDTSQDQHSGATPTASPTRGPGPGNTYAERFGRWAAHKWFKRRSKNP